jgi:RNA polymerase sigma-70 factor (ECF subfamily)
MLDDEYDEASGSPAADFTLVADEEREGVRAALMDLPEKERLLLKWVFFDERDKDDICRELQIDRGYLRVLVHRAKSRFRERFTLLSSR